MSNSFEINYSGKEDVLIIQYNNSLNKIKVTLPIEFKHFQISQSDEWWFQMLVQTYFTYKKYNKRINNGQSRLSNNTIPNQEPIIYNPKYFVENNKFSFENINLFEKLIAEYDDLKIKTLYSKKIKSSIPDNKIFKNIHKAIFLENHTILFEKAIKNKLVTKYDHTSLIEMFCFIYNKFLSRFIQSKSVDNYLVEELSTKFSTKYLPHNNLSYTELISFLKYTLHDIHLNTNYKDKDYWDFHSCIDRFLNNFTNLNIKIDKFSFVWEELCFNLFERSFLKNHLILYDKSQKLEISENQNKNIEAKNLLKCFKFSLNISHDIKRKRNLKPDVVSSYYTYEQAFKESNYLKLFEPQRPNNISITNKGFKLIDFKFISFNYFEDTNSKKFILDIKKQYVYELAINLKYTNQITHSEFWIPSFNIGDTNYDKLLESIANKFKITIVVFDIIHLQRLYIQD